jgi:2-iminobutanoate/2-iminopropanoate deaminase
MSKTVIFSEKAPAALGPYSQAIRVQDTVYVSGQIALAESTEGDIKAETHKVMENIGHILTAAGLSYQHIVKASIFLKNMDDFTLVNEVYGSYFTENPPARETVQVAKLPRDVNVEISVIAHLWA